MSDVISRVLLDLPDSRCPAASQRIEAPDAADRFQALDRTVRAACKEPGLGSQMTKTAPQPQLSSMSNASAGRLCLPTCAHSHSHHRQLDSGCCSVNARAADRESSSQEESEGHGH